MTATLMLPRFLQQLSSCLACGFQIVLITGFLKKSQVSETETSFAVKNI
jgi:hypothetical protein